MTTESEIPTRKIRDIGHRYLEGRLETDEFSRTEDIARHNVQRIIDAHDPTGDEKSRLHSREQSDSRLPGVRRTLEHRTRSARANAHRSQGNDLVFGSSRTGVALPPVESPELYVSRGGEWMKNLLYYGDNLDVLRRHIDDETVDLVYLDPPFNSSQDYNVLFAEKGTKAAAQIKAFEDTWRWDESAARAHEDVVEHGGRVADALVALRTFLGSSDMMAYLSMMAPRLVELHRAMKPSASIYLHCDSTASHYLKLVMDAVFSPQNFRAEIIWQRTTAHNDTAQGQKQPGRVHDSILFYTKSNTWTWNPVYTAYSEDYVTTRFKNKDARGHYKDADLSAARPGGDTSYLWHVKRKTGGDWTHDLSDDWKAPLNGWEYKEVPPPPGRYWAYSQENMRKFAETDRLHYFSTGMPRLKQYLEEMHGISLQDVWTDIPPINAKAAERLGYPTQKPEALLSRIISVSSNVNDVVLDPFCGCGTTISAAQTLQRRWIGIDITHLAIGLIKSRLVHAFTPDIMSTYKVVGEPTTLDDAQALAKDNHYQFQWWALGLVGARRAEEKKGADKGIDGRIFFHDENVGGKTKQVIISVKSGKLKATDVRDLVAVIGREKAEIGVLISMDEPTKPMRAEAASAGFYKSPQNHSYPRVQLLTVEELLSGKGIQYGATRQTNVTIKRAERAKIRIKDAKSERLF
jgi:DNA modification methylase